MTDRRILCAVAMAFAVVTVAPADAKPIKKKTYQQTSSILGGRPAGCPHRFCGCALSLRIFGTIKPHLNLAANWLRQFPRALPAPDMVAARRGHVFQLVRHIEGNTWLAWDANSGGGKIRLHARSIAGYTIVDPRGSRMAMR